MCSPSLCYLYVIYMLSICFLYVYIMIITLYTVHPHFDYIFCILSTYGISIFLLLMGN
ncbi:Hypothetical protein EUBREC_2184 [Agathobacter rectalis ATCC 33656]|uniref:Uncharacterized protein n=1 Tax=Agathobacter rectalis (strain ATCC 33656 / DSM 3377 / JCM 17463 / KCTC 5835 / VPI 0990) TaxID=515619 RepID=C4ZCH8_AGARV|nr:Hypothetical protein EUBREC_2184 [Agathobacter rectalis ATCC 33656]